MTSLRYVLQYKEVIGEFSLRTNLKVVGTKYMNEQVHFLFSDGEYYTVKAMEDTNLS